MRVLCLNAGSSSLKCSVEAVEDGVARALETSRDDEAPRADTIDATVGRILERTAARGWTIDAVAHRFVTGGARRVAPVRLDAGTLDALEACVPIAPLHLPAQLAHARAALARRPELPQVAAFDTAFHATMPEAARRLPLPRALLGEGDAAMRRMGYHGLSYDYLTRTYAQARAGRVVIAHLGSGASLSALLDGRPQETTMGWTPLAGLVMGTRPGDLDPGALLYLLRTGRVADVAALDEALERGSGLLGVSGIASDLAELRRRRAEPGAAEAIALFEHALRRQIGAMLGALGGLDRLIFTGGIGEHDAATRAAACEGFAFLGLRLDAAANAAHAETISAPGSNVAVHVLPTNENAVLALAADELLRRPDDRGARPQGENDA